MNVHTVDATGVRSAPGTVQEKDESGLITYAAGALRRSLVSVVTEAGVITTADIIKTSPLLVTMDPVKRLTLLVHEHHRQLSLQHDHHVPQYHPTVHASFFIVTAFFAVLL